MYIVTIREKGKGKPLLERECDCVIGAFGSAGEAHCVTGIQGKRQTLIDTYASVLLGSLLRGEDLAAANGRAVEFVQRCAAHTLALGTPVLEGVQFEPLLGSLTE